MKLKDLPKHHAVLIENSERDAVGIAFYEELKELSPAHTFFNQTVLDIEKARSIISWAQTPYNEEKIALISFHTIGIEAQNALLKILEEPRIGVRFILITSNTSNLLLTFLSRCLLIQNKKIEELSKDAETFLKTEYPLRMKLPYIVDITSRLDEEGRKERESIRNFILSLTEVLKKENKNSQYQEELFELAFYASLPSTSRKALLEYISLLLPLTK